MSLRFAPRLAVLSSILCCLAGANLHARELAPGATTAAGDWTVTDRNAWLRRRHDAVTAMLPLSQMMGVRFFQAFAYNIQAGRGGDYATIAQRHAFYDVLSFTLHNPQVRDTPQRLRCIRFFDAAADVTRVFNVGAAELPDLMKQAFDLSPASTTLLTRVNADLFERNFGVIRRLFFDWKEPRDPAAANPTQRLDALDFDLRMVRYEQDAVERLLTSEPALVTAQVRTELNLDRPTADFLGQWLSGQGGAVARRRMLRENWLPAAGIARVNFFDREHRVALGQAYVFLLHGLDQAAYVRFRANGTRPEAPCAGVLPGI